MPERLLQSRRRLLKWVGVAPVLSSAAFSPSFSSAASLFARPVTLAGPMPRRLALLIGNRDYPPPHDLPPVHKNVRDLGLALRSCGFEVTEALDLDAQGMTRALDRFVQTLKACDPPPVVLFYFAGHGYQLDSENWLLGSGVEPSARRQRVTSQSTRLQKDLLNTLPVRAEGLTMVVVDACRTQLSQPEPSLFKGFNQMEAPAGSLLVFSAQAGQPALAPSSENESTFFTGTLVQCLKEGADGLTFPELFQWVKHRVYEQMRAHPLQAIRQLAQDPFVASNVRLPIPVNGALPLDEAPNAGVLSPIEREAWVRINASTWPPDLLARCEQFLRQFPSSFLALNVQLKRHGATRAVAALRQPGVHLYQKAFAAPELQTEAPVHNILSLADELHRSAYGDKDAAHRMAREYARRASTPENRHRQAAWLRYAVALGNGVAAYDLAQWLQANGLLSQASEAEAKALSLGFEPPVRLGHSRK